MEMAALEFEWRSMGSGKRNLKITEPKASILCQGDLSKKQGQEESSFLTQGKYILLSMYSFNEHFQVAAKYVL